MKLTHTFAMPVIGLALMWSGTAVAQQSASSGNQQTTTTESNQHGQEQGAQNTHWRAADKATARSEEHPNGGQDQAQQMVRATVALTQSLDSRSQREGSKFEARLAKGVHLKDGPALPRGTVLEGTVAQDDMRQNGQAKLALRFTDAKMANGNTVPIKATIVTAYPPDGLTRAGQPVPMMSSPNLAEDANQNTWSQSTLKVNQIGVFSGVDLHSDVASQNSGVFVSPTKGNLKLMKGSHLELALTSENNTAKGDMQNENQR